MLLNMSSDVQKEQTCLNPRVRGSISMLIRRNAFIVRNVVACSYDRVGEFVAAGKKAAKGWTI